MRERIRQLVNSARRATWTEPAVHITNPPTIVNAPDERTLGAQSVRLAQIAAAMHLDQAAKLRVRMIAWHGSQTPAPSQATTMEASR